MNSLKPLKGTWGVQLEKSDLYKHFKEGQITEDDYKFLSRLMFESYNQDPEEDEIVYHIEKAHEDYANEFSDGVRAEAEYSFLVFEYVDLQYIDENGKKHKTEIK